MWTSMRLTDEVSEPGDKGAGLIELAAAGLRIPPTLVFHGSQATSEPMDVARIFGDLGVGEDRTVIARSSLLLDRSAATAVSGLYPSIRADRDSFEAVLDDVLSRHSGQDRDTEILMLAGVGGTSTGMSVLVQPFIEPLFSGVAHITLRNDRPQFRLGIVPGHLARLVEGEVSGWQCQLTVIDLDGSPEIAIIADEEDVEAIIAQAGSVAALQEIHSALDRLWSHTHASREVEWAVRDDGVWFLQSQPLLTSEE